MKDQEDALLKDIAAVRQIPIVPTMLEVICRVTGMGFAAIARVTSDRWVACSVRDEVAFGLEEGGELKIETTLCNEIRDHRKPIIIDHVDLDVQYKNHHTPKMYGLQSYISFPIILKNGTFFGTLCAISATPAQVNNPAVLGTFTMFAELLSFHLQSLDLMNQSLQVNKELNKENNLLSKINSDLDEIVYTASHDFKTPISNLQQLVDLLTEVISQEELDREEILSIMGMMKNSLKRFDVTVQDLTTIVESNHQGEEDQQDAISILEMVGQARQDLSHLITTAKAKIEVICEEGLLIHFPRKHFKSILYNLLSNAIKYRSPEREPEVMVKLELVEGKTTISIRDNGLGIPADKLDQVFLMFKRFHNHVEGSGLGLFIVKKLIDNRKGHIQVSSIENKGTTFTITL